MIPEYSFHSREMALPEPTPDAREHSNRVAEHIRGEIAASGGWISFARYMELALYAPGLGYYSAGARKLGKAGDFVTAPEISPLYGQTLARQVTQVLEAAIANENALATTLESHRPVVEAYVQTVKPDPVMGTVPVRDNYFFGRLELSSDPKNGKAGKKSISLLEDFHSAVFKPEDFSRMLILDRKRGVKLSWLDTTAYRVKVVNEVTDRIYLAANDGLIICLHDRDVKEPLRHRKQFEQTRSPVNKLLNEVIEKHPKTPWADLAQDELNRGFSVHRYEWRVSPKYNERAKLVPKY